MIRKRQQRSRSGRKTTPSPIQARSTKEFIRMVENSVLTYLAAQTSPVRLSVLHPLFSPAKVTIKELGAILGNLVGSLLKQSSKKLYAIADTAPLYTGEFSQNPRGFGFVQVISKNNIPCRFEHDIFIPAGSQHLALHGDTVLVRMYSKNTSGRMDGAVLKILERKCRTLAGSWQRDIRGDRVVPEDTRYPITLTVDSSDFPQLSNNQMVLVSVHTDEFGAARGKVIEVLGNPDSVDVQMRLVIEKFHLPHQFSQQAQSEADSCSLPRTNEPLREDLRSLAHVTIDGETAKDFDDAIAVERSETGYRLYVSIADVSHYVQPGSALDDEAFQRGTSVYFPGRVIPMLPENLSNNLCSLLPTVDRLTLTAVLDFSGDGELINSRFCKSLICSRQRLTYSEVADIIDNTGKTNYFIDPEIIKMLHLSSELAKILMRKRMEGGALGFTMPEPDIQIDSGGAVKNLARAKRNFAHQIIEEFMLAANQAVAFHFSNLKLPFIYRIHELPNALKVADFAEFAANLDNRIPPPQNTPLWFSSILRFFKGSPKEYIMNNLLLRTMQQARYSAVNAGHFGLATSFYTHFTSPIRRYPDLLVHRLLSALIHSQGKQQSAAQEGELAEKSDFLSSRERIAMNAERDMIARLCALYLSSHLGEKFAAIISGVSATALYVELLDIYANGTIPVESLRRDHYFFDESNHRLSGEIYRKIYQLGDLVDIVLQSADVRNQQITFKISDTEETGKM